MRIRELLTGLALIGLSAISVAAAVQVWLASSPHLNVPEGPNLVIWLLTNDPNSHSGTTPGTVAHLLDRGLRNGTLMQIDPGSLGGETRARFEENFDNLAWVWFISRVNVYYDLESRERERFLERFVRDAGQLIAWRYQSEANRDFRSGSPPNISQLSALAGIASQVQKWQDSASPEERQRIRQFQIALQRHVMSRGFRSLMGGSDEFRRQ